MQGMAGGQVAYTLRDGGLPGKDLRGSNGVSVWMGKCERTAASVSGGGVDDGGSTKLRCIGNWMRRCAIDCLRRLRVISFEAWVETVNNYPHLVRDSL